MTASMQRLSDNEEFRRAGLDAVSRETALVILGGLRELTATTIEEGRDVRERRGGRRGGHARTLAAGPAPAPPGTRRTPAATRRDLTPPHAGGERDSPPTATPPPDPGPAPACVAMRSTSRGQRRRQVVPHPLDRDEPGPRDRATVAAAPLGCTMRSRSPWITSVGAVIVRSSRGPVAGGEDAGELPGDAVARGVAVPRLAGDGADGVLVERVPVRADVPEDPTAPSIASCRLARWAAQHPPPGRGRRPADARRAGVRHDRDERPHPAREVRREGLADHAAHRRAHDVRGVHLERVEQAGRVPREVAEVVLLGGQVGGSAWRPGTAAGIATWVDRPASRLSNRTTRKPRPARARQNSRGHECSCWPSPATSSSGRPPASPISS